VRIGELGAKMGRGVILELTQDEAILSTELTESPPVKTPVQLVLALPRPKMLRRILRTVAELGVPKLHLINSYRVEKSYWQSPVLEQPVVQGYLVQGLEQCKDTVLPEVVCHRGFKPFVEDVFPGLIEGRHAFLAHPGDYPAETCEPGTQSVVVIGPEGGLIPYEVEKFREAGCSIISLGPRILRVENAVNTLLGRFL
jgi:RsmE family RNA methyltransferase